MDIAGQGVEQRSAILFNPSHKRNPHRDSNASPFPKEQKKGGPKATLTEPTCLARALEANVEQEVDVIKFGAGFTRLAKYLRHRPIIVIYMGVA